jgi:mono/diheme cytochrome c family protein
MRSTLFILSIIMSAPVGFTDRACAQGMEFGKAEFLRSCASCHGASGKGDGPVAKSLTKKPADLTKLSESNQGVFPVARIYDVIDGRVQVMIHGSREMPVWGDTYSRELIARMPRDFMSKELADSMVRVRILMLIEYISTLQGK